MSKTVLNKVEKQRSYNIEYTGKHKKVESQMQLFVYDDDYLKEYQQVSIADLTKIDNSKNNWLNLYGLNNMSIILSIIDYFKMDHFILSDILNTSRRTKLEELSGLLFFNIKSILYDKDLDHLRIILKDKVTLVGGHSGVGKSTLLNAIDKKLQLRTNELSDYSGKGQHTTTFAEMYALDNGGSIIDTPGIKSLAFINMEPLDVAHNFKEMFMLSSKCKYNNCLHQNEPGCAVKEGVANGEVHELRYMNYLQILEDVQDQNYWERNKEM